MDGSLFYWRKIISLCDLALVQYQILCRTACLTKIVEDAAVLLKKKYRESGDDCSSHEERLRAIWLHIWRIE